MYFYKVTIKKGVATFISMESSNHEIFRCCDIAKISADLDLYSTLPYGFNRKTHQAYKLYFEMRPPFKDGAVAKILTKGDEHMDIMDSLIRGDDYPKKPVELA
jgi:hypothetical protein